MASHIETRIKAAERAAADARARRLVAEHPWLVDTATFEAFITNTRRALIVNIVDADAINACIVMVSEKLWPILFTAGEHHTEAELALLYGPDGQKTVSAYSANELRAFCDAVHAVAAKRVSDPAVLAAIRRDLDAALCLAGVEIEVRP